jgi:hypothetical protein
VVIHNRAVNLLKVLWHIALPDFFPGPRSRWKRNRRSSQSSLRLLIT